MRRIAIYLFYDKHGQVDAYVPYKLRALREVCDHIHVVCNGPIDAASQKMLEDAADTVLVRENVGFDPAAFLASFESLGTEFLETFDELVLLNYTFFGPIGSFVPLFERMAGDDVDFWGLTDHPEAIPNPFTNTGRMPAHLQSYWMVIRRRMFADQRFWDYWRALPPIDNYDDCVVLYESEFSEHFARLGFRWTAAFPTDRYDTLHPALDEALQLLDDGCPIVKRRVFFHEPLYFDQRGVIGRDVARAIEAAGYPIDLALSNLARTAPPRCLVVNMGLLEILPLDEPAGGPAAEFRIAALLHIFYPEMADEMLERAGYLPGDVSVIITTVDEEKRAEIQRILDRRGQSAEIRIVESNRGRDLSAFLVACHDVLTDGRFDLVVKLHSKLSPQSGRIRGELFRRHLFDNLLPSSGYATRLVNLFARYPSLGLVIPPIIHIGHPTLGHAWFANREPAEIEARRIGITTEFDALTPIAAYGSMFVARPEALRLLADAGYDWDDFPDQSGYADGGHAHVLERLIAYAALSAGFHVREVLNPDRAAVDYLALEHRLQHLSSELPAESLEQVLALRARRPGARVAAAKDYLEREAPRTARVLRGPYRITRSVYRRIRPAG